MYVVVITEPDGSYNVVGPFWHKSTAVEFCGTALPDDSLYSIESVTDRDKFGYV